MQVEFDSKVVRLSAVKKAAYHLSAVLSCEITTSPTRIICSLKPLGTASGDQELDIAQTFRTSVMDYDLREQISEQTAPIRNAILAAAFAPLTSKLRS